MKLYRTAGGLVVENSHRYYSSTNTSMDSLLLRDDLEPHLAKIISEWTAVDEAALKELRAPTVANDMSSRDIEGENPLYLPQAKSYDASCALGPAILVSTKEPDSSSEIRMDILRAGKTEYSGKTTLSARKRTADSLVSYLYRQCTFPSGCFLMTGTGIVPEDSFTLQHGDEIRISIEGIGTLVNYVG